MGEGKTAPEEPVLLLRRKRAKEMCVQGKMTMREIATDLGVSLSTLKRDIEWMSAHEHIDNPKFIQQSRQIEEERLDIHLKKIMHALDTADSPRDVVNLITAAVKIAERRAKLLGLDAPIRQEIETTAHGEATPAAARAAMAAYFPTSVKSSGEPTSH